MEDTQRRVRPLTVYKASAGSGKTFTLAVEYIKLLVDNPYSYENILAVTFTNKATEEMKTRILTQLYGIANRLPDSDDYAQKVMAELKIGREMLEKRAGIALKLLLHNYNFFRVQTIDTFFQGVMRNLAKELSLSNNLRVTLNDKQVISQAVDIMMESLADNPQLMGWVEEYVEESMDDEKSWNIDDGVKKFGINLTKENYKRNKNRLDNVFSDPQFFTKFKAELAEMRKQLEEKYIGIGKNLLETLQENGLCIDDFSYGASGALGYFVRLSNGVFYDDGKTQLVGSRVKSAMEEDKGWCKAKQANRETVLNVAESIIKPLFFKTEKTRQADVRSYNSAALTLRNMNKLRLLHSIEQQIQELNGEHSRFMLSDTQTLLNEMLSEDDHIAPFIFEKIGSRIQHIMIDEFQDTSSVQWKNFKVLLEECMSKPNYGPDDERTVTNNLIVGDVKQSIYRFRSGDWRLLNNIDSEFGTDSIEAVGLKTNYRSELNVINFNNTFFNIAADIEAERVMPHDETLVEEKTRWAEQLRKAYSDVEQEAPKKREQKGYVHVRLIKSDKETGTESILRFMLENIQMLMSKGVSQKDIAILVRKNKEIPGIAEFITREDPNINLISEEAFRLDSSSAVCLLVAALKLLDAPEDSNSRASLAKLYSAFVLNSGEARIDDNVLLTKEDTLMDNIPSCFKDADKVAKMCDMALNELCEMLIRELSLCDIEGQTIYLSTFFDKLNAFITDNGTVLADFLQYWDEEMCAKTVAVGEIEGIRIMSMHKSKGLEFKHVVIPFCNWSLIPPGEEILWCNVDEHPFAKLPFIPVGYFNENTLAKSVYEVYGSEEAMQEIVDNLNLLYVAFTRAGRSLIVVSEVSEGEKDEYRASLIAKTLRQMAESEDLKPLFPGLEFHDLTEDAPLDFRFGTLVTAVKNEKESENVFCRKSTDILVSTHSYENSAVQFRQSNKSRDFAEDVVDDEDKQRFIHNGTVLHKVFSNIQTSDDIERALSELEFEGLVYNEDTTPEKLRRQLMRRLQNPKVADWFSKRWRVFNECSILRLEDGRVVEDRPDRVITDGKETIVIDYKFGKANEDYHKQVRRYMDSLRSMGHENVKGYLWYVNRNEIDEVL